MQIIEINNEDRLHTWESVPVYCYSLRHKICSRFPCCPTYCFDYTETPKTKVAISWYNGICNIRDIK